MTDSIVQLGLRLLAGLALGALITFYPFPDIPVPALNALSSIIAYAVTWNKYVPVDTALTVVFFMLTMEFGMLFIRIMAAVIFFFTGKNLPLIDNVGNNSTIKSERNLPY